MTESALTIRSLKDKVSPEEWAVRVDLAACYRLVSRYGWEDLVFTHISARVPGTQDHFLINPYGLFFDEITASSLVKIDQQGNKAEDSPFPVNAAGFVIHSAIHGARHDAKCVLHTHTPSGASTTPSTFWSRNWRARSAKRSAWRSRSRRARLRIATRVPSSRTTMNRHGCISPTDGARCAASSTRSSTSPGTSSGRKRRMSRRSAMTRRTASRSASANRQPAGSAARSAARDGSKPAGVGGRRRRSGRVIARSLRTGQWVARERVTRFRAAH